MEKIKKTRVNLDGLHSLDISVNESNKTVIAELIVADEKPTFIYAEKFDNSCNYLKAAIKKGMLYIGGIENNPYKKPPKV
ncbi:MAG: hypothetical protein IJ264_04630 [Clostridia bacterium]|nr:hypothetical protein [Clostridia bacterium]